MSRRERVIAQIEHRETDHVPHTLSWDGDVAERLDAHYGSADWRQLLDNPIAHIPVPNLVVDTTAKADFVRDPYGSKWQVNRRPFHLVEPALEEASLAGYAFPDPDAYFSAEWEEAASKAIADDPERFWVGGIGFGLFERTWTLRGFSDVLMDAAGSPEFYDELVQAVAEHQLQLIKHLLELPLDGIMFSDDWGYQKGVLLGPDRWRRFIKPHIAKMYERVHSSGKYTLSHCCGSVVSILPDIIEIGLDVLESVQPEAVGMNPYALKETYGPRITFWGALGSQSTVPFGTPEQIKDEVGRLCREMGRGGGYILAPAKSLQPETPTLNAAAVVESFLASAGTRWP